MARQELYLVYHKPMIYQLSRFINLSVSLFVSLMLYLF